VYFTKNIDFTFGLVKKNAREIDFYGVSKFFRSDFGYYIHTLITPILAYLRSSLQTSLRKPPNSKAIQKMISLRSGVKLTLMKKNNASK